LKENFIITEKSLPFTVGIHAKWMIFHCDIYTIAIRPLIVGWQYHFSCRKWCYAM